MVISGCHEGKHTPRLSEVKCPKCGAWVDVFIIMGGRPGQTGTQKKKKKCSCGHILPAGSFETDYEK